MVQIGGRFPLHFSITILGRSQFLATIPSAIGLVGTDPSHGVSTIVRFSGRLIESDRVALFANAAIDTLNLLTPKNTNNIAFIQYKK